jgi:hypothetical protein
MGNRWGVRIERTSERGRIRVPWAATVDFRLQDIDRIEDLPRTRWASGLGAHGWGGHWTLNTRMKPAARIFFSTPARLRVLGLPLAVRVLDVAPATKATLVEELRLQQ